MINENHLGLFVWKGRDYTKSISLLKEHIDKNKSPDLGFENELSYFTGCQVVQEKT